MVNKAVIAAAGRGTRFLPVVKSYPKELVPILSKPNLQYLIEEAIGAGITDIAIVTRINETSIQKYFSSDPELENYLKQNNKLNYLDSLKEINNKAKLTFIPQSPDLPYGTGSVVLAAKKFINNEPFVYMYGDDLTIEKKPGEFLSHMISTFKKYSPALVVAVKDVGKSEIHKYGCAQYVNDPYYPNRISGMLEKLPADLAPSTYAQSGRFVVIPKVFQILEKQSLSKDNELWFADAENTLAKTDVALTQQYTKENDWMTTGDPLRWLKTNIAVALTDPEIKDELQKFLRSL